MEKNEKYTGKGKYTFPNRDEYSGDFVNGLPEGFGIMKFADYNEYEGEWVAGRIEGRGVYKFYDMEKDKFVGRYEGSFLNSKFHGEGRMKYPDHAVYYGNWIGGQRNGMGQLLLYDGTLLSGIWQNDHLTEGVAIIPNGQRYSGSLGHGYCFDGWGTLFSPDGSWLQGEWSKGEFVNGNAFNADGTCQVFANGKQITVQEW